MQPSLDNQLSEELSEHRSNDISKFLEESRALIRGRTDTVFFCEYWLGIPLNAFQKRLFSVIDDQLRQGKFVQIICPTANQVGKTVANALLQIKWNFYKLGALKLDAKSFEKTYYQTLNLSPISRQSKVCMQYVEQILTNSFTWEDELGKRHVNKCRFQNFLKGKNENIGRLEYANNSSTHFVSTGEDQGANIQGAQFGMITYDECVLSMHLKDELPSKIFSRLAKYGNLLLLIASPKSEERANSQQYFYHLAQDARAKRSDFIYVSGVLDENKFIPQVQREAVKARLMKLNPNAYREVVEGEFITAGDRLVGAAAIQAMWNGRETQSEPISGHKYVIIADWGFSDQGDKTVFGVFDITNHPREYELSYGYSERGGDPWKLMALLTLLKQTWNDAAIMMDVNALGGVAMKKMLVSLHPMGFESTGESKMRALSDLVLLLTEPRLDSTVLVGHLRSYYISELEEELASYRMKDDKIEQDWVMVLAMFAYYCKHRLVSLGKMPIISLKSRYNSLHNKE